MRLRRSLATFALVAPLALTAPAGATRGSDDPAPTGGPVYGTVVADHVNYDQLGLCSRPCAARGVVSDLPAPDQRMEVDDRGRFVSSEPVPVGAYRIRFDGSTYDGYSWVNGFGYLRRLSTGRYDVVSSFSKGTVFQVTEGALLNVGNLNLKSGLVAKASWRASSYGGGFTELSARITVKDLPRGATASLTTVGCGGRSYVTHYRKPGSYRSTWRDGRAASRYGRTIGILLTIDKPGDPTRVMGRYTDDISDLGWRCRR